MPTWAAIVLLYIAHLWSPPFVAARSALMPEILPGEAYILGNGLSNVTLQICQVAGFALGGVIVAAIGSPVALLVNAATFALSAAFVAVGVSPRPVPKQQQPTNVWQDFRDGVRYVGADSWLRACLLLVWAASAFSFAIEGVAYPFAVQLGGGPRTAGLLLAMSGVGFAVGAVVLTRVLTPQRRDRLLPVAALLSVVALIPITFAPELPIVLILLMMMGAGASFSAPLNAMFVRRVTPGYRGRAMGIATSGLLAVQGGGFLVAGVAVDAGPAPSTVVGWSGITGSAVVLATVLHWRRVGNRTAGYLLPRSGSRGDRSAIDAEPAKDAR
jgi:predicted MFS family arabinose efflux permease